MSAHAAGRLAKRLHMTASVQRAAGHVEPYHQNASAPLLKGSYQQGRYEVRRKSFPSDVQLQLKLNCTVVHSKCQLFRNSVTC